jgi:hypothetical protein
MPPAVLKACRHLYWNSNVTADTQTVLCVLSELQGNNNRAMHMFDSQEDTGFGKSLQPCAYVQSGSL